MGKSSASILLGKAFSDLGGFFACLKMRLAEVMYHENCINSYLLFDNLNFSNDLPVHEYKYSEVNNHF